MERNMIDFMEELPELAQKRIEERKELTKKLVDVIVKKKYKKIHIVACGSSYSIAIRAMYFMRKYLGIPVEVTWSYTFVKYHASCADDDTLYLLLTQSGCSTNTIAAAEILRASKKDCVALTDDVTAPIRDYVKVVVSYGNTPGDFFVTKGMCISTLFLMLASLEAALQMKKVEEPEYDRVIACMQRAVAKITEAKDVTHKFYEENKILLWQMERVMILGCGPSYSDAVEGALKLQETYCCMASAVEVEEYCHGPQCEVTKDTTVFFVDGAKGKSSQRLQEVYGVTRYLTDRAIFITTDECFEAPHVIRLKDDRIDEEIAVLYEVVPFEYLSWIICRDERVGGITRSVRKFDRYIGNKTPNLNVRF